VTKIETKNQTEWSENGIDNVIFTVATNKGTPPAPLHKIASGGELSRFMLALKVILSKTSPIPCLVFDEVDSDIGGATAAAVGKRLALLAKTMQVLVITHSPQVAALGNKHMYVKKQEQEHSTLTSITILDTDSREKEIARMLAGATITTEALAAARSLLKT
ncbi:MAG: DNA repair protein RecN, partial [Alphaproteobacteria bacterium]|nr:DNA repair protein RecN [Alphaproteobacteria bacterium]